MIRGVSASILAGLLVAGCNVGWLTDFEFGFRVVFVETPDAQRLRRCGTEGNPWDLSWRAGPHDGFRARDPGDLARDSEVWLASSKEIERHRRDREVRLELVYPGDGLVVTACRVPPEELAWEAQLRAWFAAFPPVDEPLAEEEENSHGWYVTFGTRGEVRGDAPSEAQALAAMRALVARHPADSPLVPSTFHLASRVRRTPHEMDVYTAEVESLAHLDELPAIVHHKMAEHEQWR